MGCRLHGRARPGPASSQREPSCRSPRVCMLADGGRRDGPAGQRPGSTTHRRGGPAFRASSAASVVERYAEIVNRERAGDPLRSAREALASTTEWSGDGLARMLEAGLQAIDGAARLVSSASSRGTETLVLPTTEPGRDTEASLWIHNRTSSLVASVELHATLLVSPEESQHLGACGHLRPGGGGSRGAGGEPRGAGAGERAGGPARRAVPRSPGGFGAPDGAVSLLVEVQASGQGSS